MPLKLKKYIIGHIRLRVYSLFLYFTFAHIINTCNVWFIQIVSNAVKLDGEIPTEHAGSRVYLFFLYFPLAHIINTYNVWFIQIVSNDKTKWMLQRRPNTPEPVSIHFFSISHLRIIQTPITCGSFNGPSLIDVKGFSSWI